MRLSVFLCREKVEIGEDAAPSRGVHFRIANSRIDTPMPAGIFVYTMLPVPAGFEPCTLSQRVKEAWRCPPQRSAHRRGEVTGAQLLFFEEFRVLIAMAVSAIFCLYSSRHGSATNQMTRDPCIRHDCKPNAEKRIDTEREEKSQCFQEIKFTD